MLNKVSWKIYCCFRYIEDVSNERGLRAEPNAKDNNAKYLGPVVLFSVYAT